MGIKLKQQNALTIIMCNTCGCKSAESDSHQHCAGCQSHDLNAESIFCASCTKTMDAETYGSETMEKMPNMEPETDTN